MRIVVVGAGQVGGTVAQDLCKDHEIVVIDHDPDRIEELRYDADVMTLEGNGADIEVLEEAGVDRADIVIASTDDDQANILVCGTAHGLDPDVFTVARVTNTGYLRSWEYSKEAFNVDLMVGSDYLTAKAIVEVVFQRMAREVAYFDAGRIEMAEFNVPADHEMAGMTVAESDKYEAIRYAAIFHDNTMEVAGGDTVIPPDSRLLVIGEAEEVRRFSDILSRSRGEPVRRMVILGGGEIAYQTARLLEEESESKLSVKLIEPERNRAQFLAEKLPDTMVINEDPLDPDFLTSEGLQRADIVLSALRPDERNLMAALQAEYMGASRVVSVVDVSLKKSMFEHYGVETTFTPRRKVIEQIIRHTRSRRLEKVAFVEQHRGEVIEIRLGEESLLVDRPLREAAADFPSDVVVGAVSRNGEIIIPTGDTVLHAGDDVVLFVDTSVIDDVLDRI